MQHWTIEVYSAGDSWQMKILRDIDERLMRQETELSAPFAWYKLKTIYYHFKKLRNLLGMGKFVCEIGGTRKRREREKETMGKQIDDQECKAQGTTGKL